MQSSNNQSSAPNGSIPVAQTTIAPEFPRPPTPTPSVLPVSFFYGSKGRTEGTGVDGRGGNSGEIVFWATGIELFSAEDCLTDDCMM
jgi:hypothetical protein